MLITIATESLTSNVRAFFIIVKDEEIVRLIMYYLMEIRRNMNEILRAIKALQLVNKVRIFNLTKLT